MAMAEYGRLTSPQKYANSVAKLIKESIDQRDIKPNTLAQYRLCEEKISHAFQNFAVDQVETKDIAEFMELYRDTPNMANRMLSVLRFSFDRAARLGMCKVNPCTPVERFKEAKRDRLLTNEEFLRISNAGNDVLKCVMALCYLTAQRINDVLGIKLDDITEQGILFQQAKTGKKLIIKMNPALSEAVEAARSLDLGGVYLLGQKNGEKRGYYGVRDLFRRACRASGVKDATLHDIRAKALTDAEAEGINPTKLAGHSTQQQTLRYLRGKSVEVVEGVRNFLDNP